MTAPALVIIGGKDKAIPIKFQEDIAEIIPNAVKITMDNEGHAVAIENSRQVLSEIEAFIDEWLGV